jgi:hypothetical protein
VGAEKARVAERFLARENSREILFEEGARLELSVGERRRDARGVEVEEIYVLGVGGDDVEVVVGGLFVVM